MFKSQNESNFSKQYEYRNQARPSAKQIRTAEQN